MSDTSGNGPGAPMSLLDLCRHIDKGRIVYPPHQRGEAWTARKIRDWITDIRAHQPMDGVIMTYTLKGNEDGIRYLNDGGQRMRATLRYYHNPEAYHDTPEVAETVLLETYVTVQHRVCEDWNEAYKRFVRINYGTNMTAYEAATGIFTRLSGYEAQWRPFFDRLHSLIHAGLTRMIGKTSSHSRKTQHKFWRDDYGLFFRFVTGDTTLTDYATSKSELTPTEILTGSTLIEHKLARELERLGRAGADAELIRFERALVEELALAESLWWRFQNERGLARSETPNLSFLRWVLNIGIFRRVANIDLAKYQEYLWAVICNSSGGSTVFNPQAPRRKVVLAIGSLSKLRDIDQILGLSLVGVTERTGYNRNQKRPALLPGHEHSHIMPVSTHGEGPTISEPAVLNRKRGAQPMFPSVDG